VAGRHSATGFGTDRLLIGGESAGTELTVQTLLRLRDWAATHQAFRAAQLVLRLVRHGADPERAPSANGTWSPPGQHPLLDEGQRWPGMRMTSSASSRLSSAWHSSGVAADFDLTVSGRHLGISITKRHLWSVTVPDAAAAIGFGSRAARGSTPSVVMNPAVESDSLADIRWPMSRC
jgi:hypothetical protein